MGKPYSEDLRERVIGAAQDGTTIPEIAEQFGVSISLRIPTIATTHSDGSRPPVPIDRDQCGAGADRHRWMIMVMSVSWMLVKHGERPSR